MKKTAIFLIAILLLSTVSPFNALAASPSKTDSSEISNDQENKETVADQDNIESEKNVAENEETVSENDKKEKEIPSTNEEETIINEEEGSSEQGTNDANDEQEIKTDKDSVEQESIVEETQESSKRETADELEGTSEKAPVEDTVEDNNQNKMMKRSFSITSVKESTISKLGHIRSTDVDIYNDINNLSSSFKAGTEYTQAVYFIKKQALVNGETYYLLSNQPSSTNGLLGWAKSSDLSTHTHKTVDKKSKTLYFKGTGSAYSKAWGGSKDLMLEDMSQYAGQKFSVDLTETIGSNTWYRGDYNGEKIWLHSSYLTNKVVSNTSRLGHLQSGAHIYETIDDISSEISSDKYLNAVYYIKSQAKVNNATYYLLSTQPSRTEGVVGWVKSSELSTHEHKTVDKKSKTLYFKGTGSAYSKAWGGNKDLVYGDMSKYADQKFNVNLTETVGNNTWYRGDFNGETIWLHSSYLTASREQSTSMLGHIRSSNVKIYDQHDFSSYKEAGTTYTNAVYYIKKQTDINGQRYYLLSTQPSSTKGIVGWVKSSDLSTHAHETVDKNSKTLYFKGTGSAYSKAWGGNKDLIYGDMSKYAGQMFSVDLTETVGSNTWYRGNFDGEKIWLHSSYLSTKEESNISRLGHLRNGATIYETIGDPSTVISSKSYLNAVYYIKQQAEVGGETFYLISEQPSRTSGTVGWVNEKDMSTYSHVTVDKKERIFYIKGTGSAYSKAWGGSKDLVSSNLAQYEGDVFKVNLTEKVGNNTWYRGVLNGRTAWMHSSYLAEQVTNYSNYNLTLAEALGIQMTASPQTDKEYKTYVSKKWIDKNHKVTADALNVRGGTGTNYWVVGQITKGTKVNVIKDVGGWYQIEYTKNHQWVNPNPDDILYYLDPTNFINDDRQKFQFLDLSRTSNASPTILNNYLRGKGTLANEGQAFIDAGQLHGISDIYLVSHAILETGNGESALAQGVMYKDVKVYNMFGIGAYDDCPVDCGAKKAYEEGWTTPSKAIVGGAQFIGNGYIKAGQNTLYKMRWDPTAMASTGAYGKQYATDIGWASKQVGTMYNLYQALGIYNLNLDIPVYKK